MACVTIVDLESNQACFACNTTDMAFGPIMSTPEFWNIAETVADFREELGEDPRRFTEEELCAKWNDYILKVMGGEG